MTSKGGNHRVEGFNIYGNNIDALKPWKQTAQANLTFRNGRLSAIELTDGGKGYELAVQAAADNNTATSTENLKADQQTVVALNYNIDEIQYLVRDPSLYNDFYLITNSQPVLEILGKPGEQGSLKLTVEAASQKARQWLRDGLKPTSGYNGTGSQSFSSKAQAGDFIIYHQGAAIAQGSLENGHWEGTVSQLPKPTDRLVVDFAGDPITSYNVNFKPFNGKARVIASPKNTEPSSDSFFREDNSQALFTSPMLSTPQPEIWQAAINPLTGDALS
jgi:hypothetical protein